MTDTQMSWLHILVKDRGSTFIIILKIDFLARQIVLVVFGQAVPVKKGIVLFVFVNTTVLACQELHSELTLFSCLTGFSLPTVLFTPVLAVDHYLMSAWIVRGSIVILSRCKLGTLRENCQQLVCWYRVCAA